MAYYPENTGGIIAAINACILAAGGTVTSYNNNTGGIIQALLALQTAIAGMGGGSAVEIELTAGEALSKGDVVFIDSDGKLQKAIQLGVHVINEQELTDLIFGQQSKNS